MKAEVTAIALTLLLAVTAEGKGSNGTALFGEITSQLDSKVEELFQQPFFVRLSDESIPIRRRMTFIPYWTYFAMGFADACDTWFAIENPENELEERVNVYIAEDSFHYNFFLNDVEKVLGYTLDRFGSYAAVLRHVWGDDTRAVREYIYGWLDCVNRYKDPVVTLATFEAVEMTLKPIFTTIYKCMYLPENGLKDLEYFGQKHVQLEANHSQFSWFNDEGTPFLPIGDLEITVEQRERGLEVANEIYERSVYVMFLLVLLVTLTRHSLQKSSYI